MKKVLRVFALLCIGVLLSFTPKATKILVIDAGHGGKDYGAVEGSFTEKEIVRQIGIEIASANNDVNIETFVIGREDVFVNLEERVKAINSLNPDMLISLHLNASPDSQKRGANAYVSPKNVDYQKSKQVAASILRQLNNGETNVIDQNLFVIKNVKCPAITLEVGYLTNKTDQEALTSAEGQKKLARQILNGLSDL